VEYFNYLGNKVSNAVCKREITSRIAITKALFNQKQTLVTSNLDVKLRKESSKMLELCMVLKLGEFGNWIRNNWKFLKCGAEGGWRD
jgi:hypothetical protein